VHFLFLRSSSAFLWLVTSIFSFRGNATPTVDSYELLCRDIRYPCPSEWCDSVTSHSPLTRVFNPPLWFKNERKSTCFSSPGKDLSRCLPPLLHLSDNSRQMEGPPYLSVLRFFPPHKQASSFISGSPICILPQDECRQSDPSPPMARLVTQARLLASGTQGVMGSPPPFPPPSKISLGILSIFFTVFFIRWEYFLP